MFSTAKLSRALHLYISVKGLYNILLPVWFVSSCVEWGRSFWVKQPRVEDPVFVFWDSRAVSILTKRGSIWRVESSPYSLHGFHHGEARFVVAKETGLLGAVNDEFMVSSDFTAKECFSRATPMIRGSISRWVFTNYSKLTTCTEGIEYRLLLRFSFKRKDCSLIKRRDVFLELWIISVYLT